MDSSPVAPSVTDPYGPMISSGSEAMSVQPPLIAPAPMSPVRLGMGLEFGRRAGAFLAVVALPVTVGVVLFLGWVTWRAIRTWRENREERETNRAKKNDQRIKVIEAPAKVSGWSTLRRSEDRLRRGP